MVAAVQIIAAIAIGILGYMWALCLDGMYDGILSLVFQPLIAAVVSGVAVILVVAPTGLLLRLLLSLAGQIETAPSWFWRS